MKLGGGIGNRVERGQLEVSELGALKKFEQLLVIRRREGPAIVSRMAYCQVDWNLEPFKRYLLRENDSIRRQQW